MNRDPDPGGGASRDPWPRRALVMAWAATFVTALLALRVGPFHDPGFLIDDYSRLASGLTPHVDYATSIPQLATVVMQLVFPRANDIFFLSAAVDVTVWLASAALMCVLARRLGLGDGLSALCLLLWCVAADPNALQLNYNRFGAFMMLAAALLALRYRLRGGGAAAFALGMSLGVALFFKPSFGIGAALMAGLGFALRIAPGRVALAQALRDVLLAAFGGGTAAVLCLLLLARGHLAFIADPAILGETLHQIFLDAAGAKGGIKVMARWIPRLKVEGAWVSASQQLVSSLLGYVSAGGLLLYLARRRDAAPSPSPSIAVAAGAVVAVAVVAGFATIPAMAAFNARAVPLMQIAYNAFYLFGISVLLVTVFVRVRHADFTNADRSYDIAAAGGIMAAIYAIGASSIDYPPITGVLLFPCLARLLMRLVGPNRGGTLLLGWLVVIGIVTNSFGSYRNNGFRANCALPTRSGGVSLLAGAAPNCARFVAVKRDIAPHLAGKTVIWLTSPFGFGYFWGTPVSGLGDIYWDGYAPRVEAGALQQWARQKPDAVVMERRLSLPAGSSFAPGGAGARWLAENYSAPVPGDAPFMLLRRR